MIAGRKTKDEKVQEVCLLLVGTKCCVITKVSKKCKEDKVVLIFVWIKNLLEDL